MSPYSAVLFDFFGTLTQAVVRGPWHLSIARALGCPPAALTAVLDRSFPDRARGAYGSPEATLGWVCQQLELDPPPAVRRAVRRARVAAVRADTRLRPDAVPVLTELRARGLRTAVVSDCGYELPEFFGFLPVAPLLDAAVFSVEVGQCKPHPAMYGTACRQLGVAPEECLYVGDGGSRELSGARSAGMCAVRLAAADLASHLVFAPDHEFTGPQVRVLSEVLGLLGRACPDGPGQSGEQSRRAAMVLAAGPR